MPTRKCRFSPSTKPRLIERLVDSGRYQKRQRGSCAEGLRLVGKPAKSRIAFALEGPPSGRPGRYR